MNKLDFFEINSVEEVVQKYKDMRLNNPILWSSEYNAWVVSRYDDIISILNNEEVFSRAMGDNYLLLDKYNKEYIEENREAILYNNKDIINLNIIIHNYYKKIYSNFDKNILYKIFSNSFNSLEGIVNFKEDLFSKIIIDVYINFFNLNQDIKKEFYSELSIKNYVNNNLNNFDIYKYIENCIDNNDLATKNIYMSHLSGFLTTIFFNTYETMMGCYSIILNNLFKYDINKDNIDLFVKESLRLASFNMSIGRKTINDHSLSGTDFRCGDTVILLLGSGNYQEEYFGEDSNIFNLNRKFKKSTIEFGHGLRFCIAKKFINEQLNEFSKFIIDNKHKILNLKTTYDSKYKDISSPIKNIYGTIIHE